METLRTSSAGAKCQRRRQIKWRWTLEEDDLLMKLVKRHGAGNWNKIAYHIEGRSGKSCRLRWINHLNPEVARIPFSEEERQRLLKLHERYGNRWSITASHFPGRTCNQVKNECRLLVGTKYMMAPGASSSLPDGQVGFPICESISTVVSFGAQFSNGSCHGNYYCGFAPCFDAMAGQVDMMMPVSSVYGKAASIHPHQGISPGDSMTTDANSAAAFSEPDFEAEQRVVGTKDYQFIDFMGVGSTSE